MGGWAVGECGGEVVGGMGVGVGGGGVIGKTDFGNLFALSFGLSKSILRLNETCKCF